MLTIIPTADRQKATVKVRISFDKLDPRNLPDMGVKVSFLIVERAVSMGNIDAGARRVVIPQAAAHGHGDSAFVFVVHDGKLERRAVNLGSTSGSSDVEVIAGVKSGDQLVVGGPNNLHDGEAVSVKAQ